MKRRSQALLDLAGEGPLFPAEVCKGLLVTKYAVRSAPVIFNRVVDLLLKPVLDKVFVVDNELVGPARQPQTRLLRYQQLFLLS